MLAAGRSHGCAKAMALADPTVFVIDANPSAMAPLAELLASVSLNAMHFTTVSQCLRSIHPGTCGCLLADTATPEALGLVLSGRMARIDLRLPVIYLSDDDDVSTAAAAMKAGAADYFRRPVADQQLLDAVQRAVLASRRDIDYRAQRSAVWQRFSGLTPREWDVLPLVVRGCSSREIGQRLEVSEKTVEVHRRRIFAKIGVASAAELVRLAIAVDLLADLENSRNSRFRIRSAPVIAR